MIVEIGALAARGKEGDHSDNRISTRMRHDGREKIRPLHSRRPPPNIPPVTTQGPKIAPRIAGSQSQ